MGPTWVLSAPDGPHVDLMNLAIRVVEVQYTKFGLLHDVNKYMQRNLLLGV